MSRKATTWSLLAGLPLLAGGVFWMLGGLPFPVESDEAILVGDWGSPAPPDRPESLRVLSYNIHFGIGHDDDHTKVDRAEVERVLQGIARLIRELRADVVLLQEVDFNAARTFGLDQMQILAAATDLRHMAPVTTWKKGYIPFPYWPIQAHYGRMHSGQAILSRFPIVAHKARRLPKPEANPFWYNAFYITRTIQEADIAVGDRLVRVYNIHNEAFDLPNRVHQTDILIERLEARRLPYTLVAGDFNAVPPEATRRHAFADEPETDMRADTSIARMRGLAGFEEIIPEARYRQDESAALTFPADAPNRRLDYFYYTDSFHLREGRVVHEAGTLSDHLPTLAELEMKE